MNAQANLRFSRFAVTLAIALIAVCTSAAAQAQGVTVEQVLAYQPAQEGVDYETPKADEVKDCQLKVDKLDDGSAWVVLGPQGQVIRRFVDSDGNGTVDQFRYYQHGLEVYRDYDRNENRKIDESRWLNMAGSRWGTDRDEDGTIDVWKMLSAEEASKTAIEAMATGNTQALAAVLISSDDVKQLGVTEELAGALQESVKNSEAQMKAAIKGSKVLQPKSKWLRFDTSMLMPGLIPSESGKAAQDLHVYENVMVMIDNGGTDADFVLVGEMVRVGDVWKLTRIPLPLEGDNAQIPGEGILMQPELPGVGSLPGGAEMTPEVRKLLEELSALDKTAPGPTSTAKAVSSYSASRAGLLGDLAKVAATAEERKEWKRQQIDGIAAATQTGNYVNGLEALQSIEVEVKDSENIELVPYIVYRRIMAEYNTRLQTADAAKAREEIQKWWLEQLNAFVKTYPAADDSPEAALQLAIGLEFSGEIKEARQWYEAIVKKFPTASSAKKARGAVHRLNLVGQPLTFSGDALSGGKIDLARYRGRVLLVIFWATWCDPCTKDLPQIQALYKEYQRQGFEVVGINLDVPEAPIQQYLDKYSVSWPQIHEDGGPDSRGLESRPATDFGIISLPTMLLVDKEGKVTNVATSVDDLKKEIPQLLK